MRKTSVVVAVATAGLSLHPPAASAWHPYGCDFVAVHQATATGQDTYEGFVVGHSRKGLALTAIRCVVRASGTVRGERWGAGAPAVTAGRLPFVATVTEAVQICAESEGHQKCAAVETTEVPPYEVWQVWHGVDFVTGPLLYPTFGALAGYYGPVAVHPDGDVYVDGEHWYECPPYDWESRRPGARVMWGSV